jgi:hypothetical protein
MDTTFLKKLVMALCTIPNLQNPNKNEYLKLSVSEEISMPVLLHFFPSASVPARSRTQIIIDDSVRRSCERCGRREPPAGSDCLLELVPPEALGIRMGQIGIEWKE